MPVEILSKESLRMFLLKDRDAGMIERFKVMELDCEDQMR